MFMEDRRALYYPYVHFRDDEWLKKTLLVFPGLVRMVPEHQTLDDSELVQQLRQVRNERPLIAHANLQTENVARAQETLGDLISRDMQLDADAYRLRFGLQASRNAAGSKFQMNLDKTSFDFGEFLRSAGLAWRPENPERAGYWELHPTIGQAVMGTIAVACAQDAGLSIVAPGDEQACRELNSCLALGDVSEVYHRFVQGDSVRVPASPSVAQTLLEFIVFFKSDVSGLDAKGLAQLAEEREAMHALKSELERMATRIPSMTDKEHLAERLKDEAGAVLKRWKQDRANLSNYAKTFFGGDKTTAGVGGALKEITEKIAIPVAVGTAASHESILGVSAGLGIGVIVHAVNTAARIFETQRKSTFRYLTLAERHGVVFSVG